MDRETNQKDPHFYCVVKQRGPITHYLSQCRFISRATQVEAYRECESDEGQSDREGSDDGNLTRSIQAEQSPYLECFHKHIPVRITLDSGATENMIRRRAAVQLGAKNYRTKQSASQADGSSQLEVRRKVKIMFTRDDNAFKFDGLVVERQDVDVLGGVPFMKKRCLNSSV